MYRTLFLALCLVFLSVVLYQLVTGHIALRGMLSEKSNWTIQAERVQSLLISMGAMATYAGAALNSHARLPDVDLPWLLGLGGSQLLFLAGKFIRLKEEK